MKTFNYKQAFGRYLRSMRLQEDISQEAFAFKLGINRTYYGKIERGENSITLDKIEEIAKFLQISISDLFLSIEENEQKE